MSTIIEDKSILKALLTHYEGFLSEVCRSQRTGSPIDVPESATARLQLLSYALYDPEVALVWGSDLAYSQLGIWVPLLARSKKRHVIFAKSLKGKPQEATKLPNVPAYTVAGSFGTKDYASAARSLHSMLYMTDKNENFNYIRAQPKLIHVGAHHGDSDKHSSGSRIPSVFDFQIVADSHSMLRYLRAGAQLTVDRFIPIGNTVIDGIVPSDPVPGLDNVLYAPTFEGHSQAANFSSLLRAGPCIEEGLDQGLRLAVRPHPGSGLRDAAYKRKAEALRDHRNASQPGGKIKQFNWSQVLITDVSGVLSEYLFTKKPIVLPLSADDGWLFDYVRKTSIPEYAYLWDYKRQSLADCLQAIASDPLRTVRLERRSQLYCGVESIEESVELFDSAMDYFKAAHRWRSFRDTDPAARTASKASFPPPEDEALQAVVQKIKRGQVILGSL